MIGHEGGALLTGLQNGLSIHYVRNDDALQYVQNNKLDHGD